MRIRELCDLLEVKSKSKKEISRDLFEKLAPIIMRFNVDCWLTASMLAKKGGRSERELKYLEQKGLVYLHGESSKNSNVGEGLLYKMTDKGVEAYKAYRRAFMKR